MSRRKSREQAFALLFEKSFNDLPVMELAEGAQDAGAEDKLSEIDARIDACSHKWSRDRISRVALAVMRLAIYEMLYDDDTPVSVAINEAVELAKRYGGDEDSSFVNGILGTISRESV